MQHVSCRTTRRSEREAEEEEKEEEKGGGRRTHGKEPNTAMTLIKLCVNTAQVPVPLPSCVCVCVVSYFRIRPGRGTGEERGGRKEAVTCGQLINGDSGSRDDNQLHYTDLYAHTCHPYTQQVRSFYSTLIICSRSSHEII